MKKTLKIISIISFLLPIIYFNSVLFYIPPPDFNGLDDYFIGMYYLIYHWTSGEMGYSQVTYPLIVGIVSFIGYKFWEK